MSSSGDLIKRNYSNFRGVDFSNKEVALYRSPDALNMWKNYKNSIGKCIETRPDIRLYKELDNTPYGVYFFIINNIEHMIVHCGVSLYDYNTVTNERKIIKATGMNPRKSQAFIFNNIFYIKDGINYLEYDGETCKEVEGYIPTTTTGMAPIGGGTDREVVNVLTPLRKNAFCADGESTEYHLDQPEIDNEEVKAWINDVETTDFTVDYANGVITFKTAPEAPDSVGQDNVVIQFSKATNGHRDRINKCTLLEVFDNRVFFSGNQDYPNQIFNSKLNNPRYISDDDHYNEGMDMTPVRAMITGNNALWVLKEPSEAKTSIFYHNPAIDDTNGKAYPSVHSSITTGCVSTGINFNDDIVFFSERGMEAINGDVTTEQVVAHRSSLIDNKLLREENYRKLILQEYEGYLMVFIDNKVYLADSRGKYTNVDHVEYEWFYWELSKNITYATVNNGVLYLCSDDGIYILDSIPEEIKSYWTTPEDEFGNPQLQKITNKRGCIIDMQGEEITISAKTDNEDFETINTYTNVKGYVVPRIKKKKWKSMQIKFSSNKPFGLFECTLESYIGAYVKR